MDIPFHLRSAQLSDALQLLGLMEQRGYPQTLHSMRQRLAVYSNALSYNVTVAETKAPLLIGVIALAFYDLFVFEAKRARIESLIVHKDYLRQSVGTQLLKQAEAVARAAGCKTIEVTSSPNRARYGVHAFYQSQGFYNEGDSAKIYFRKELAPPELNCRLDFLGKEASRI